VIMKQRHVDDLVNLASTRRNHHGNHALFKQIPGRADPLTLCGWQDGEPTRNGANLLVPYTLEARTEVRVAVMVWWPLSRDEDCPHRLHARVSHSRTSRSARPCT